jgi:hypothetical protein
VPVDAEWDAPEDSVLIRRLNWGIDCNLEALERDPNLARGEKRVALINKLIKISL